MVGSGRLLSTITAGCLISSRRIADNEDILGVDETRSRSIKTGKEEEVIDHAMFKAARPAAALRVRPTARRYGGLEYRDLVSK